MSEQQMTANRQGLLPNINERWRDFILDNSMLIILLLFIIFAAITTEGKFTERQNLNTLLYQSSTIGVLAIGQALVMVAGGIDLSQATILILVATLMGGAGSERQQDLDLGGQLTYLGLEPAILLGLGAATFIGFMNGFVTVIARIPPFITTLVSSLVVAGATLLLTGGAPIYYPNEFFIEFGQNKLLDLPYPVYVWFLLSIIFAILLARSKYGSMIYALGGNERAALLCGLRVGWIKIMVFTLSGILAGVAGFLYLSRTGYVTPVLNDNYLLQTIAAVVVGGVSMSGGRGGIRHAFLGVLILGALSNWMNIQLISPHVQDAVAGAIIIAAVMLNVRIARD